MSLSPEHDRLTRFGMYDPADERDACGVGFVAAIDGSPRRDVVEKAIAALKAVWHRGAVDADGKTGDGAGIHLQIPQDFFRAHIERTAHIPASGQLGIGMIFLPRTDFAAQETCRTIIETEILKFDLRIYGWRQVPVDTSIMGEKANATRPEIEQIMFDCGSELDQDEIERTLYIVRRRIEKEVQKRGIAELYICSLSCRSLIYKGLFLAAQLSTFYPDLKDPKFTSAFAIYHQRYSTNTFPTWRLAQPFRMLAHNGEINTLKGNVNWMRSHEAALSADAAGDLADDIRPVVQPGSSDSASMDAAFELLVRGGHSAPLAKLTLIPEAWSKKVRAMPKGHRAMFDVLNSKMEPWDGPAAIAATDGRWVLGGMDRSGLRPMRYSITTDGLLLLGSEAGMVKAEETDIIEKGRVGPGQLIAINLEDGKLYRDRAMKDLLSTQQPYAEWAKSINELDDDIRPGPEPVFAEGEALTRRLNAAGVSHEDLELVLQPMVQTHKEAIGSMGDDTPLAVLSTRKRPLAHYFRQNFSQVTNPPIDPLREDRVMSLRTRFGNLRAVLSGDSPQRAVHTLESPFMSSGMVERLRKVLEGRIVEIDCTVPRSEADTSHTFLRQHLTRIREEAEEAVRRGFGHLILTDEAAGPDRMAIPMILATAAAQTHLVASGLRAYTSLNVRSGEAMDTHSAAVLIGCGATTVNAYLAEAGIAAQHAKGLFGDMSYGNCIAAYLDALDAGLLKIMSKMGISMVSSYRGGFNYEAVGLSRALVAEFFPGVPSRISGIGLLGLQDSMVVRHDRAYDTFDEAALPIGGFYRQRADGETHGHEGTLIHLLQSAVTRDDYTLFKKYSAQVASLPPISIRDLMDFSPGAAPIPVDEVESVNEIRKRFVTPGMSLGALSPEAHRTLNIAMNRIGARSDSGEGGENPDHYKPNADGDNPNSAIKQIASGRFGVTAEYLNQCSEIEIKIAQGAKPGEGGQLPGFKVTEMIAKLRHSSPGVTLISPPPHHDIYSIEDLAQLIYDLKQVNTRARVGVKLVSAAGIGTIAAGVAKAKADIILISGHSGGTGASPLTSLKFAGSPWELGLAEVNQVLTLNGLRHRIRLRTDGGLRTGRDIVMAALLGAEEFGIGTASLIAMGCLMVRQCQSNTCPVGVCTQDEELRERFGGSPEKVINLFSFLAEEVREILAGLGARHLNDIIGRTDLLAQVGRGASHLDDLDLNPLLVQADPGPNERYCTLEGRNPVPDGLDAQILKDAVPFFERRAKMQLTYTVRNTDRAIGTMTSGQIVRQFGRDETLRDGQLTLQLRGSAGQSLGAFGVQGLRIEVFGEANDYVGKGLSGATIVLRPAPESRLAAHEHVIIGNTVLYGATSGRLFASGRAGERFAVRNSGADAVIEGCGANGCEYMTGGTVVILGDAGDNFAAGMTGGMAFVFDPGEQLQSHLNGDSVQLIPAIMPRWEAQLKALITDHMEATGSLRARSILADWDSHLPSFVQICPKERLHTLVEDVSNAETTGAAAE